MAKKTIVCDNIEYDISYELINQNQQNSILFLHGWGSNKEIMRRTFSKYLKDFKLIFVDLPGFGNSSISKPLDSLGYKDVLSVFLKELNITPLTICGHSFGGKLATLLNPKNVVLLSSAGIVLKKSLKVRLKIRIFKLLKLAGFSGFYKFFASKDVSGMNGVMYETFKMVVDEKFDDYFSNYGGKALIFWGKEDTATPLKCGKKIEGLIKNSKFYQLDGDHFFFLSKGEIICKKIEDEL